METRACIKKLTKDLLEYGENQPIKIITCDMIIDNEYVGQLCDYEIFEDDMRCISDSTIGKQETQNTMGWLLKDLKSPLVQSRLMSKHGIQYEYKPMDIINHGLYEINKQTEDDERYCNFLKNMCSKNNINVDMNECIEQDLEMFDPNLEVIAFFEIRNNHDILTDWIIKLDFVIENEIKTKDNCFTKTFTLNEIYNIIKKQGAGEYYEGNKAKILSFPK